MLIVLIMKNRSMEWDKERLTVLTLKHISGELTIEEQVELNQWLNAAPDNRERFEERIQPENILKGLAIQVASRDRKEAVGSQIDWRAGEIISLPQRRWRRMAAAILVPLLVGGTLFVLKESRQAKETVIRGTEDLPPGGNKAILTLANGSKIVLDKAKNGIIAQEGHNSIVKNGNDQLIYKRETTPAKDGYNTVTTPRGGQYQVALPDGTRVWLNAASSIRFPTNFSGERREVDMTGEVYFEVAHQEHQPFIVHARDSKIEDIGTHFNINAYEDESEMKTTLIEGMVKIGSVELHPGQQFSLDSNRRGRLVNNADLEEVMAWKNGLFAFNGADIRTVMRNIGRWYDVSIIYEAGKDSHRFTGQISRSSKASEALQILTASGYHFNIQDKIITVRP
jgi:transmembrane sensor